MVNVLVSFVVCRGFEPRSGRTNAILVNLSFKHGQHIKNQNILFHFVAIIITRELISISLCLNKAYM
jgi:hypothetical protein